MASEPGRLMIGASLISSGWVPSTKVAWRLIVAQPEQVAAFAGEVAVGGDEQAQVELVGAQVVGDQFGALPGALVVSHALGGAGGVAGGGAGAGVVGEWNVGELDVQGSRCQCWNSRST
jgi:hypothetical protein